MVEVKSKWKCLSNFRRHGSGYIQLEWYTVQLLKLPPSTFNLLTITSVPFTLPLFRNLLNCPYFRYGRLQASKALNHSKSVGLDDISGFVRKGCSGLFIPILKRMFNLSLPQQCFPVVRKEAVIVPIFETGNHAAVSKHRPFFLNN
jgi:hypothetical protein